MQGLREVALQVQGREILMSWGFTAIAKDKGKLRSTMNVLEGSTAPFRCSQAS